MGMAAAARIAADVDRRPRCPPRDQIDERPGRQRAVPDRRHPPRRGSGHPLLHQCCVVMRRYQRRCDRRRSSLGGPGAAAAQAPPATSRRPPHRPRPSGGGRRPGAGPRRRHRRRAAPRGRRSSASTRGRSRPAGRPDPVDPDLGRQLGDDLTITPHRHRSGDPLDVVVGLGHDPGPVVTDLVPPAVTRPPAATVALTLAPVLDPATPMRSTASPDGRGRPGRRNLAGRRPRRSG